MTRAVRSLAFVLALTFGLLASGAVVSTQDRAYAGPLIVPAVGAVGAAVPLSVVSAAVGGGISTISAGGALASAGITAAAVAAGNWIVSKGFTWSDAAPATFGDAPSSSGGVSGVWSCPYSYFTCSGDTMTVGDGGTFQLHSIPGAEATVEWPVDFTVAAKAEKLTFRIYTMETADQYCSTSPPLAADTTSKVSGSWRVDVGCGVGADGSLYRLRYLAIYNAAGTEVGTFTPDTVQPTASAGTEVSGTEPLSFTPTTRCVDGGGVVRTYAGSIVKTTRSTSDPQVLTFPACPAGETMQDRSAPITRDADSELLGDALTGEDGTSTPWAPPVVPAIYPDCQNRTCVVTLTVTAPDGDVFTCAAAGVCPGYAQVVQQYPGVGEGAATGPRVGPDGNSYQCSYGPYALAVAECQVVPGAGLGHGTSTDTDVSNCVRSGISWNPVSWVEQPVACVLKDAFEISPATKARIDTTRAIAETKPPFGLMQQVSDWLGVFGTLGQQCPSWNVAVAGTSHGIVCESAFMQKIHANRLLFGAVMTLTMLAPFVWRVWHASIPVVKVNSGS